ncbi:MAG: acetyl-CoA decarbonylase/synthase complex subunit gamma, partial [bacterium]
CLKKNFRPLGYPLIGIAGEDMAMASNFICKYAGMVIVETEKYEELLAMITLRLNIYTDPQKPLMMEPKLYEVGKPGADSPVIVTTNFSLTFYTVQPEIENSKIPAWLVITDSEGQSVLTAWAADKFNAEVIARALQEYGVAEKVGHKKLIIPGYVAVLKVKVEEESGWEVLVGPKEASALPKYLKESWKQLSG